MDKDHCCGGCYVEEDRLCSACVNGKVVVPFGLAIGWRIIQEEDHSTIGRDV